MVRSAYAKSIDDVPVKAVGASKFISAADQMPVSMEVVEDNPDLVDL